MRKTPADSAELVNQCLFGERVETGASRDGWSEARSADGYSGWVETKFLREADAGDGGAFVAAREASVTDPDSGATVLRLSYGSRVPGPEGRGARGHRTFALPGGGRGAIDESVLVTPGPPSGAVLTGETILSEAEKFLGVPYLWGGRSGWGVDCSGFVQLVFARFGITIPRDSRDQALAGEPVTGDPRAGDLLFFGSARVTHVGFAYGDGSFLHASGWVRRNTLVPGAPGERADLAAICRGARRIQTVECPS